MTDFLTDFTTKIADAEAQCYSLQAVSDLLNRYPAVQKVQQRFIKRYDTMPSNIAQMTATHLKIKAAEEEVERLRKTLLYDQCWYHDTNLRQRYDLIGRALGYELRKARIVAAGGVDTDGYLEEYVRTHPEIHNDKWVVVTDDMVLNHKEPMVADSVLKAARLVEGQCNCRKVQYLRDPESEPLDYI